MTNMTPPKKTKSESALSVSSIRDKSSPNTDSAMELWLDDFCDRMAHPGRAEEDFFAHRRLLKLGAGIDESGRLVKASTQQKK
mgnify:CR=1 FL=1